MNKEGLSSSPHEESMSASFLQEMMGAAGHDVGGGEAGEDATKSAHEEEEEEEDDDVEMDDDEWDAESEEEEEESSSENKRAGTERRLSREEMMRDFVVEAGAHEVTFAMKKGDGDGDSDSEGGEASGEMEDLFASNRNYIAPDQINTATAAGETMSISSGLASRGPSSSFSKLPSTGGCQCRPKSLPSLPAFLPHSNSSFIASPPVSPSSRSLPLLNQLFTRMG